MALLTGNEIFIHVPTGEYPITFEDIRWRDPNIVFGTQTSTEDLQHFNYHQVMPTPPPEGDVLTNPAPELIDGVYYQRWESRPYTQEELDQLLVDAKTSLEGQVDFVWQTDLETGLTTSLPGFVEEVNVKVDDQTRLHLLGLLKIAEVVPGNDTVFFNHEDKRVVLTDTELQALTLAVVGFHHQLMVAAKDLKQAIRDAVSHETLPIVPESFIGA